MNIILNPYDINPENVFFLEKKKNNIIDGCFSKIIYSTDFFTMNGVFITLPLLTKPIDIAHQYDHRYTVQFYSHDVKNLEYIARISEIENAILTSYKLMNGIKKTNHLVLTNQLYNGYFKIYRDKIPNIIPIPKTYAVKISGLWENLEEIGITYKFMEVLNVS